ncbi:MAG: polysulfide reductase NrfD [Gemmatimonadetes bacterium]|nr:polysulfide reductase NrfD [Gemmatimonadota bacterium]
MNYAWVIDQTSCIGCHACTTACKSENDVPLGVFRTWVKNVEVGRFPDVRRHFAVLRCNHCANPPCVHICPTRAMHQRPDGIVDIEHDRCIGCKACMQACPYDAIYMDPVDETAAKCHFCAHRVDQGLLPACVVVCPTESLLFGDLDDPNSRVSRVVGSTPVTVRRPDQGTRPKAFYVGAHAATLDPLAARHDSQYMWAERPAGTATDNATGGSWGGDACGRSGDTQSPTADPPIRRSADLLPPARVAYDVPHPIVWRWKVSAYLWTKSLAAGAAFVAAVPMILGTEMSRPYVALAPVIAMVALVATGVLLIADLKRPERFWFVLAKPHWRSWLTRGAYLITGYGVLLILWLLAGVAGASPGPVFSLLVTLLALGTAVYTAFLFGQCEARDLWQSPLVGVQLALQMIVAGSAALVITGWVAGFADAEGNYLAGLLAWALGAHALTLLGELTARHASTNAGAAALVLTRGRYAPAFWFALTLGALVPLVLLIFGPVAAEPAAAVLALAGLLAYEHAFVMAGQAVPIS